MICPRACGANRAEGQLGVCGADASMRVARIGLHQWEEPPLSAQGGSGAIFFSHCSLGCIYCQNAVIAHAGFGKAIDARELALRMIDLEKQGALNINLVTPTHYAVQLRESIKQARSLGLSLPVMWNTSGYETSEQIFANEGLVQIYLSDFKYASPDLARRLSGAPDYPEVTRAATEAMIKTAGLPRFDEYQGQQRLIGGVVVRHLLLPGHLDDSKAVLDMLASSFKGRILLSLMNQYTPVIKEAADRGDIRAIKTLEREPALAQTVTDEEYEALLDYADDLGFEDYFWQEGQTCEESFIPAFDLSGV